MGKRSEPRKQVEVPVRLFGTDSTGVPFSAKLNTVNVSRSGVELSGAHPKLAVDEIVGLTYGTNRVHFRVKWIGEPGTPRAGHVGLLNIAPEKPLWDFPLPGSAADPFQPGSSERRRHPRFRCQNSVEVYFQDVILWGTLADLSLSGCFIEMSAQLEPGTKLRLGIWFGQNKTQVDAQVMQKTPGMGVGLKFLQLSAQGEEEIRKFLASLSPFAKKGSQLSSVARSGR